MSRCDTGYIKLCPTCEHYPNDKHCVGCTWDKDTGDNTKWESRTVIERKVLEQIRDEIEREGAMFPDGEFFVSIDRINEIIDTYR